MGIGVLIFLILTIFLLPSLLPLRPPGVPAGTDSAWILLRKNRDNEGSGDPEASTLTRKTEYDAAPMDTRKLNYFDPNTLSEQGWVELGVKPKTAATIIRYRSKGGAFRKPEDLQKIYGLPPALYEKLLPWVRIGKEQEQLVSREPAKQPAAPFPVRESHEKITRVIDINTSDTTAFIALPGIGSKLANRIVSFREKLGGFYAVEQLGEVFGLADSVLYKIRPQLKLAAGPVRKIRINSVTIDELKTHPYFRYELAKTVIAYRNAHGAFRSPEDIKQVALITDDVFRKIAPYLSCE